VIVSEAIEGITERHENAGQLRLPGGLAVYAAAAGLASALPVPLLDQLAAGLARGAALRRVSARRGVRLTREARRVLAAPSAARPGRSVPARLVRAAAGRVFAPLRVASRLDDALATYGACLLLDHYLRTSERIAGAPLGADEARRLRAAMDAGGLRGSVDALKAAPRGFVRAVAGALRAAVAADDEDRSPLERLVDALLDAAADAPVQVSARLTARFDAALMPREDR